MGRTLGIALLVCVLAACAPTPGKRYWAFPPGTGTNEFRVQEARCRANPATREACLTAAGYQQITEAEHERRQQAALDALKQPSDIVGYDVQSHRLFIGKSQARIGTRMATIELESGDAAITCTGSAEMTRSVPGGRGSLGTGEVLCKDGRKITAEFVYETPTSGYGRGVDSFRRTYRFIFGKLNLDHDQLRTRFKEMIEDEQRRRLERSS